MTTPLVQRLLAESEYTLSLIPNTVGERRDYLQTRAKLLKEAAEALAGREGEAVVWQYRFQDDVSANWAPWQEANSQESADRFAALYARYGFNTETRALYTPSRAGGGEVGEEIGCLTISRWKGSDAMVNHDFDYYGDLPDGSYCLYTANPQDRWRSIESAPKDGTRIITWGGYQDHLPTLAYWDGEAFIDCTDYHTPYDHGVPTHWKPLPQPPTALHGAGVRGG